MDGIEPNPLIVGDSVNRSRRGEGTSDSSGNWVVWVVSGGWAVGRTGNGKLTSRHVPQKQRHQEESPHVLGVQVYREEFQHIN